MDAIYHFNRFFEPPLVFDDIDLVQIGRMFCAPDTVIGKHLHLNWFELTVVSDGKGILITNDTEIEIKRGDIYLSFPADEHAIRSDPSAPLAFGFLAIYPHAPIKLQQFEEIMFSFRDPLSRLFCDERLPFLLDNALAEFDSEKAVRSKDAVCHLLALISEYLIRDFTQTSPPERNERKPTVLCYNLMHYIDTHILTLHSLAELEDIFNYNYSYLSKLFKTVTGKTLSDYYTASRLKKAEILLKSEHKKIGEIADLLGYSSIYSFSKAFKARYGLSPDNFRIKNSL